MSDAFDNLESFSSNDVDLNPQNKVPTAKLDRFQGEKDHTYRAAIVYFRKMDATVVAEGKASGNLDKQHLLSELSKKLEANAAFFKKPVEELAEWQKLDISNISFKRVRQQFSAVAGVGVVESRHGLDGPEADKIWASLKDSEGKISEPKEYYYTLILLYPTNSEGEVDKDLLKTRCVLKPWRFTAATYNRLIELDQKMKSLVDSKSSLANFDLSLKCTNKTFQNFTIDVAEKALWTRSTILQDAYMPKAYSLYEKFCNVRKLTTPELREKLGLGGVGSSDSGSDVSDFNLNLNELDLV